jgi:hypothetical protein
MLLSELTAIALAGGIGVSGGCDGNALQKDLGDAVKSMQDTVSTASGATTGSIELSLSPPVELDTGFARFTPPAFDRPGALELTSYKTPEDESFPSVYLRIESDIRLVEDLKGKSVPATLFVQMNATGEVWHTDLADPPQITVESATSSLVICRISETPLTKAGSDQTVTVSGQITGVRH